MNTYHGHCERCGKTFNDRSQAEAHGQGRTFTALQIRLAYEAKMKCEAPGDMAYRDMATALQIIMGCNEAAEFIQSF